MNETPPQFVSSIARVAGWLGTSTGWLRDAIARDPRFPAKTPKGWPLWRAFAWDSLVTLEKATLADLRAVGIDAATRDRWLGDFEEMLRASHGAARARPAKAGERAGDE